MSEQEQEQPQETPPAESESGQSQEADAEGGTPQGAPGAAEQAPDGPHGSPQPK